MVTTTDDGNKGHSGNCNSADILVSVTQVTHSRIVPALPGGRLDGAGIIALCTLHATDSMQSESCGRSPTAEETVRKDNRCSNTLMRVAPPRLFSTIGLGERWGGHCRA